VIPTIKRSVPTGRRAWFTTLLSVAAILLGGLGTLFSLLALLLAVRSPYGNTADPLGILVIFILPPGTLLAGFGLLFRPGNASPSTAKC
jgi:hypothetical protein